MSKHSAEIKGAAINRMPTQRKRRTTQYYPLPDLTCELVRNYLISSGSPTNHLGHITGRKNGTPISEPSADQGRVQSPKLLVVEQEGPCLFRACAVMFILGICTAKLEFDLSISFSGLITNLDYQRRSVETLLPFRTFHPRRRTQARQRIQESLNF